MQENVMSIHNVAVTDTDAALLGELQKNSSMREALQDNDLSPQITIRGYEDDPRELWQIPEVCDLCKRLVRLGFLGELDCRPEACTDVRGRPFGGVDIFSLAHGARTTSAREIDMHALMYCMIKSMVMRNYDVPLEMLATMEELKLRYGKQYDPWFAD